MKLDGKVAIVSGANQGLGFEIAKHFLSEGACVAICARTESTLKEAYDTLSQQIKNPSQKLIMRKVDVSHLHEVESFVRETVAACGRLDILVANAGVYGPKGLIDEIDWSEWSTAIDINLKGVFYQCRAVLPEMKKQQSGKIIILSGGGATKPMPNLSAYAASKAGVVRLAETLAEEVKSHGIDVNSVAPGALNTRLLDEVLAAGPQKVGESFYQQSLKQKQTGGTDLSVGSSLCVFLATAASNGITGRLLSAVWDPWHDLPQYLKELNQSDVYTLRRIVPSERGLDWKQVV